MADTEAGTVAATERKLWPYQRTNDVSGIPLGEVAYWLALMLAAGADMAAFHQVVSLVMAQEQEWLIWLLVGGLTTIAVTLAHFGGRIAREVAAGMGDATRRSVLWCAVPWVLLGLAAVVVRVVVAESNDSSYSVNSSGPGDGSGKQIAAAVLFAMLYFASGMVAAIGEFLSRNPHRTDYRRALRAHRKAQRRLAKSQPRYERPLHVSALHRAGFCQDTVEMAAARHKQEAYGEELKRRAAALMAAHLQDPSATDGMTEQDRRPFNSDRLPRETGNGVAVGEPSAPIAPTLPRQVDVNNHNHSKAG